MSNKIISLAEHKHSLLEREKHWKLVQEYLPFAKSLIYKRYDNLPPQVIEDLHSVSKLALYKAASTFDQKLGTAFATYAYYKLIGAYKPIIKAYTSSLWREVSTENTTLNEYIRGPQRNSLNCMYGQSSNLIDILLDRERIEPLLEEVPDYTHRKILTELYSGTAADVVAADNRRTLRTIRSLWRRFLDYCKVRLELDG